MLNFLTTTTVCGFSLYHVLAFFLIYSCTGWCLEVIFAAATTGQLVNRGFLNGPVCPIYGFGMVIVLFALTPLQGSVLLLYIGGVILPSALELVGGWALYKLYHTRWWDYSDFPFNIGGYICLEFSLLDKLVLATGSSNRVPQVPGSDRVGVQTLKTVEDLIFLKEFVRTPYVRDIVILGGSWAGLEIAKSFLKLGRNVRIIEKEQQLLPQFDPEVSKLIQKELEAQGVQFNLGEQVRSFPGRTFVEQVQTNRGTYPCDLCVVAIGVTPNTGLLAGTGAQLAPNGAVLIGADLATSVPNIYAVGDCAACRDGSLRTSSLKVADLEIARTGLTETEARKAGLRVKSAMATGTDRPGICPNPHRITIKLVYEANTRQVLGAQAWGEKNVSARINAIAVAIRAGMTVEALGQVDFVYSSSSCSIWDPVQIVCGQAQ